MEQYGNVFLKDVMQVLILTGSFACAMAFHNVTMRYFYAMGREGILPARARQDAPQVQVGVRREHHPDRGRARARAGLGHRLRLQLRRLGRHRLRPHLHDDGRPGRGLAARHPGRVRAGRAGVAPAPQAPRQLARRGAVPDHRDRRPGVRDLPAVQEHRRARRHDRLRRPDRPDRDHRRGDRPRLRVLPQGDATARSSTWSAG